MKKLAIKAGDVVYLTLGRGAPGLKLNGSI
jgi:hypothetical protein